MHDFARSAQDDRELLARFAGGDEEAFGALVERYSGLVYGTAMRRLANEEWAGDAAQNVFVSLSQKAAVLVKGDVGSVGAWLHRATTLEARRVLRDRLSLKKRDAMVMQQLSLADGLSDGDEAIWREIRPELDEALLKLSARDREVLVLHYFDGLKFKEVAVRLGVRADAAQKRGKRALEKLASLLRARSGAAALVTVLAAGLKSELAQAAPATLAGKILAAKATPTMGGSASLLATMLATSKAAVVVAFAILAALIGIGYLIVDATRDESPEGFVAEPAAPKAAVSPSALWGRDGADEKAAAALGDEASAAERFVARVAVMLEERRDWLADVQRLQQAGGGEAELEELFLRMEDFERRSLQAAEALSEVELAEALVLFDAMPEEAGSHLAPRLVFFVWGKRDPAGALAAAEARADGSERPVFGGWARLDPNAALARYREIAPADREVRWAMVSGIFEGWLSRDPKDAIAAFEALEVDEKEWAKGEFGSITRRQSTRGELFEAVSAIEDEHVRTVLIEEIGGARAQDDAREVFDWFDRIEFEDPQLALRAAKVIFGKATRSGSDFEAAVDWIWPHLSSDQRYDFILREIRGTWARKDADAAEAWLERHEIETRVAP